MLDAIGRGQLRYLNERVRQRRAIFDRYAAALSDLAGVAFMPECSYGRSNRWLTVMTLDPKRCPVAPAHLLEVLAADNIEARPVWKPLHLQPVFAGQSYYPHESGQSVSDELFAQGICLPSGTGMTVEDQERVIAWIRKTIALEN